MAKTLRVGMIGYGFMGRVHSNAWRQVAHFFPLKARVELHAVCGRNRTHVEAARAQLGWQYAATDWREVVESPLVDIVDICTSNDVHAEIAIAAARAGKHVLCEKPLALTPKQAGSMLAAVQKAKVVHMVCHNYRRIPAITLAKRMMDEGAVGQVYHYHARYAQDWLSDPEFPLKWRLQKELSGSGAHGDIHVHIIDLARYLVGEFQDVCGLLRTFIPERPLMPEASGRPGVATKGTEKRGKVTVDDAAALLGRLENGAMANLEASRVALGRKNHITIEINGNKGSLYFDFEDMNRLKYFNQEDPKDRQGFHDIIVTQPNGVHPYLAHWWGSGHVLGYEHPFVHTVADFVNACVEGKPVQPTFEDGFRNQQVLAAVEQSVKTGRWVKL